MTQQETMTTQEKAAAMRRSIRRLQRLVKDPEILANWCEQDFKRKNQIPENEKFDPSDLHRGRRRLLTACKRVKQTLSDETKDDTGTIEVDALFRGIDFRIVITRDEFKELYKL